MKYTQAQIEAGIKFLNNANVHLDTAELEDNVVNININVGKRIWTSGDSIWNNGVVKGVKVGYISLIATYEDWDEDEDFLGDSVFPGLEFSEKALLLKDHNR